MTPRRVTVVGGGIVGLAAARALVGSFPDLKLTVLEKEADLGAHQSTHNSGVLHAGLAYSVGSAKARLTRRGIRLMVEYCAARGIPYEICGKLIVASDRAHVPRLEALLEQGTGNGLRGLRVLKRDEAREIEPHVECVAALRVPEEGIVDFGAVCRSLATDLREAGVEILRRSPLTSAERRGSSWRIRAGEGVHEADFLIACAGLHADRLLEVTGHRSPVRIIPFRGEYYRLRSDRQGLVRSLIYPLAEPGFPFLGVHLTRRISGAVDAGPNAVLALSREGYDRRDLRPLDAFAALSYPGLWRFVARHHRMVRREIAQSIGRRRFLSTINQLVPELREDDLLPGPTGVRAQAMLPSGHLVDDFLWVEQPGALHVLNAPSPAATASLAIGAEIADRAATALRMRANAPDATL